MSIEENKRLVRRQFEELLNKKNYDVIESDMAEDFLDYEMPPHISPGRKGVKEWMQLVHSVIPDIQATIENCIAEGDKVVVRNTWRGSHTGLFLGIPPTGKKFTLKGIVIWRIEKGRIKERWATLDLLGLRQQLQPE